MTSQIDADSLSSITEADQEQIRRARRLLETARECIDGDLQFIVLVGALHLSRSIVEHWLTRVSEVIPQESGLSGAQLEDLRKRLRADATLIFEGTSRYSVISELRNWDYHWEPLVNPMTVPENSVYGRGAPVKLTTGPAPNSGVTFLLAEHKIITTGSGRQVGRKNYYRIQQKRFVDFCASEAAPLSRLIGDFLDDLPTSILKVLSIPEVADYLRNHG